MTPRWVRRNLVDGWMLRDLPEGASTQDHIDRALTKLYLAENGAYPQRVSLGTTAPDKEHP